MTLKYRTIQRLNPRKLTEPGKFYARAINRGDVTLRQLVEEIAVISTVSSVDTIAVIESLIQLIPKHITSGETVKLGDFGSFSIGIKSRGADKEDDFTSSFIDSLKIYFRPGKELKRAIKDTDYEKEQ
jgi:predicted histone-like DNA-binding protein